MHFGSQLKLANKCHTSYTSATFSICNALTHLAFNCTPTIEDLFSLICFTRSLFNMKCYSNTNNSPTFGVTKLQSLFSNSSLLVSSLIFWTSFTSFMMRVLQLGRYSQKCPYSWHLKHFFPCNLLSGSLAILLSLPRTLMGVGIVSTLLWVKKPLGEVDKGFERVFYP